MKSRSVSILDEADDFESKLRWILFKAENEAALRQHRPAWWDDQPQPNDSSRRRIMYELAHLYARDNSRDASEYLEPHPDVWEPGVPLHRRPLGQSFNEQTPRYMYDLFADAMDAQDWEIINLGDDEEEPTLAEIAENCLRRICGSDDDNYCVPCEVTWRDRDQPCWVCGEPGGRPARKQSLKPQGQMMRAMLGLDRVVLERVDENESFVTYRYTDEQVSSLRSQDYFEAMWRWFNQRRNEPVRDRSWTDGLLQAYRRPDPPEENQAFVAMDPARNPDRNDLQRLFVVTPHRAGRGQMVRQFFLDEWVGSAGETEPENTETDTCVVNVITIPAGFDPIGALTDLSQRPDLLPEAPEVVLGRAEPRRWETPITEIRRV